MEGLSQIFNSQAVVFVGALAYVFLPAFIISQIILCDTHLHKMIRSLAQQFHNHNPITQTSAKRHKKPSVK